MSAPTLTLTVKVVSEPTETDRFGKPLFESELSVPLAVGDNPRAVVEGWLALMRTSLDYLGAPTLIITGAPK